GRRWPGRRAHRPGSNPKGSPGRPGVRAAPGLRSRSPPRLSEGPDDGRSLAAAEVDSGSQRWDNRQRSGARPMIPAMAVGASHDFDLVVLGAGTGGYTAAF